jgi:type VI secretion system secreted protein Hcp
VFLRLDGIPGDSADAKHQGEIQIESFSLGATNPGSTSPGGGGGAGKVTFQDLHVVKQADKASPKLFEYVATGKHIPTATLTVERARRGQAAYYVIEMKDVLVSSFQVGGGTGSPPYEDVSLAFGTVEIKRG